MKFFARMSLSRISVGYHLPNSRQFHILWKKKIHHEHPDYYMMYENMKRAADELNTLPAWIKHLLVRREN